MSKINAHIRRYSWACDKLGIEYEFKFGNKTGLLIHAPNGTKQLIFKATTPLNKHIGSVIANNKHVTIGLLAENNIPVPEHYQVVRYEKFLEKCRAIGPQLVVKPLNQKGGKGVTVLPKQEDLHTAFKTAKKYSPKIIVEKFVPGINYRFLVLDNRVLSVAVRYPPYVIGDGASSIGKLLEDYNLIRQSKQLPAVKLNEETIRTLASQNFTIESIPQNNQKVYLRLTANLSLGGTTDDITELVPEVHKETAVKAAQILGLRLSGIDFISEDITDLTKPAYIIEANSSPGMRIHYSTEKGSKLEVAQEIVKAIVR